MIAKVGIASDCFRIWSGRLPRKASYLKTTKLMLWLQARPLRRLPVCYKPFSNQALFTLSESLFSRLPGIRSGCGLVILTRLLSLAHLFCNMLCFALSGERESRLVG